MKLKEMDIAMETCLQFYMPAIREKFPNLHSWRNIFHDF